MSAEYYATFSDATWIRSYKSEVLSHLESLPTFIQRIHDEFRFRGTEKDERTERWPYDVRMFLLPDERIMLEISAHPPSIESDLKSFLAGLRSRTEVNILDEDGEKSTW